MRIALVADWLTTFGGAEHVIAEFHAMFPQAPIFTTVARHGSLGLLNDADIRTTYLQRLYTLTHQYQILLPWMPRAIETIDLRGYDIVLSSSHAVAKGVIVDASTLHLCYCHTPVRYAWEMEDEYLRDFRVPHWIQKRVRKELSKIRRWDLTSAKRVDAYIANSTTTQERIKRIYNRESDVIPPPVSDRFFKTESRTLKAEHYYLAVGRMVPYKRFDLLIQVANELQLPLKIAGRGQDEKRLRALAGPTVEFLGFVPEADLPGLYANATALFFPQYEDAGIVLLEAQATGTPVIAYNAGGAKDMIHDGKTGIFFDAQTTDSVRDAVTRFSNHTWNRELIRSHAMQFSEDRFRRDIRQIVETQYRAFCDGSFRRL
ncbi:glycosyltransferase [Candidatus Peribacteria bacterium]|nr:MAG: glycosyltransferase [Candidatus Peribacteria bacterium]